MHANRMSKLAAGLCGTRKCAKVFPRRLKKRQSSTYFQSICMKFTFCIYVAYAQNEIG